MYCYSELIRLLFVFLEEKTMWLGDLFKPKWKHSDWRKREAAVKNPTDKVVLGDVVLVYSGEDND